jgi:hypothetical protein
MGKSVGAETQDYTGEVHLSRTRAKGGGLEVLRWNLGARLPRPFVSSGR